MEGLRFLNHQWRREVRNRPIGASQARPGHPNHQWARLVSTSPTGKTQTQPRIRAGLEGANRKRPSSGLSQSPPPTQAGPMGRGRSSSAPAQPPLVDSGSGSGQPPMANPALDQPNANLGQSESVLTQADSDWPIQARITTRRGPSDRQRSTEASKQPMRRGRANRGRTQPMVKPRAARPIPAHARWNWPIQALPNPSANHQWSTNVYENPT